MACSSNPFSFLVKAPFILAFLFLIDWMTPGGSWWHWAALGIGFAWVMCLFRAIRILLMVGGLAGLAAYFGRRGLRL